MNKINSNKRELAPKQREELLRVLKGRFEKNMNRHQGLEWAKVQGKLEAHTENCGRLMKWKELVVNRMLLVMIKRRANTFFMIVHRKVLKTAEVFATTVKRWRQGKNINQQNSAIGMLQLWVLSF